MNHTQETLMKVVERYLYHKNYKSNNPEIQAIAKKMCDIELYEMWALSQK